MRSQIDSVIQIQDFGFPLPFIL